MLEFLAVLAKTALQGGVRRGEATAGP